jgi:hypothetical protein
MTKGDVITIPAKTPHWFKEVPTKTVAYYGGKHRERVDKAGSTRLRAVPVAALETANPPSRPAPKPRQAPSTRCRPAARARSTRSSSMRLPFRALHLPGALLEIKFAVARAMRLVIGEGHHRIL